MRYTIRNNEYWLGLTVFGLSILIGLINPVFFSVANLFDLLRSTIVIGIFAMAVLMVILSGDIDVSFTAVAVFSMYVTVKVFNAVGLEGPIFLLFAAAGSVGLVLGLINAFFTSRFNLPALIVTLGTLSLYRGFLLFFIGSVLIRDIPGAMTAFSRSNLISVESLGGAVSGLHTGVLLLMFVVLVVWLILRYTAVGRGIYAMGGDREAAVRAGFNLRRIKVFIYGFVGLLSGTAGLAFGALNRQASPFDIVGSELDVIAAVVIGGAQITGGRGTVGGTLLGVCLVVILNNSLILVGIPSVWQKVVIGLVIIIGTGIPAYQNRKAGVRRSISPSEKKGDSVTI